MKFVFEVIDDDGEVRSYIASYMRREADKLMLRHRESEVRIELFRICDWCAVDEEEEQCLHLSETRRFGA